MDNKTRTVVRKPEWSDAQYDVFSYWASQHSLAEPRARTEKQIDESETRRKIQNIIEDRNLSNELREIWE